MATEEDFLNQDPELIELLKEEERSAKRVKRIQEENREQRQLLESYKTRPLVDPRIESLTWVIQRMAEEEEEDNEILKDLNGNIRVFCRAGRFPEDGSESVLLFNADGRTVSLGGKVFKFDGSFDGGATQESVFNAIRGIVESSLEGRHVCIFAYGLSGSGKTHTMFGDLEPPLLDPHRLPQTFGVIPRALHCVLQAKSRVPAGGTCTVVASLLERSVDGFCDLMPKVHGVCIPSNPYPLPGEKKGTGKNARTIEIHSMEQALELIKYAKSKRCVASTGMNNESSRSHFCLRLDTVQKTACPFGGSMEETGSLSLVDLGGNQRMEQAQTHEEGQSQGIFINTSLSELKDGVLWLNRGRKGPMPKVEKLYRFMEALFNPELNGRAVMIANLRQEEGYQGQTMQTLNYAKGLQNTTLAARK